jgi:hypothetical protein
LAQEVRGRKGLSRVISITARLRKRRGDGLCAMPAPRGADANAREMSRSLLWRRFLVPAVDRPAKQYSLQDGFV